MSTLLRVLFASLCAAHIEMCAFHIARAVRACRVLWVCCRVCCVLFSCVVVDHFLLYRCCTFGVIRKALFGLSLLRQTGHMMVACSMFASEPEPLLVRTRRKVNFLWTVFAIVTSYAGRTVPTVYTCARCSPLLPLKEMPKNSAALARSQHYSLKELFPCARSCEPMHKILCPTPKSMESA